MKHSNSIATQLYNAPASLGIGPHNYKATDPPSTHDPLSTHYITIIQRQDNVIIIGQLMRLCLSSLCLYIYVIEIRGSPARHLLWHQHHQL